jgi:hypothetical protein
VTIGSMPETMVIAVKWDAAACGLPVKMMALPRFQVGERKRGKTVKELAKVGGQYSQM